MADLIYSYQVLDADGNTASVAVYAHYTSATLAQLMTYGQNLGDALDNVMDVKVEKMTLTINIGGGSFKGSPVAGSNVQETGLITFDVDATPYSFSLDVPGLYQTGFVGKLIDLTESGIATLTTLLTTPSTTIVGSDRYNNALLEAIRGRKTFRK